MDLEYMYHRVKEALSLLDFNAIWPGFEPLKFALYDNEKCFYDGRFIEKTDEFCANTSILFHGEQIAVWMMQEQLEVPVLASKIVHEMFHGFQDLNGWDCKPNDLDLFIRMRIAQLREEGEKRHVPIILRDSERLLLSLLESYDLDRFNELVSIRKLRSIKFPYEFDYECRVEEVEGTANYVEWQALKQLDENRAAALTRRMRELMLKPEYLFPIRVSCYFTGALMINTLRDAGRYEFECPRRPLMLSVVEEYVPLEYSFSNEDTRSNAVSEAISAFNEETEAIVAAALENNDIVLKGPYELIGVNVYNARCYKGFITSTYFLMYSDGKESGMLQGDFVIKMSDERIIDTVYRWVKYRPI